VPVAVAAILAPVPRANVLPLHGGISFFHFCRRNRGLVLEEPLPGAAISDTGLTLVACPPICAVQSPAFVGAWLRPPSAALAWALSDTATQRCG